MNTRLNSIKSASVMLASIGCAKIAEPPPETRKSHRVFAGPMGDNFE